MANKAPAAKKTSETKTSGTNNLFNYFSFKETKTMPFSDAETKNLLQALDKILEPLMAFSQAFADYSEKARAQGQYALMKSGMPTNMGLQDIQSILPFLFGGGQTQQPTMQGIPMPSNQFPTVQGRTQQPLGQSIPMPNNQYVPESGLNRPIKDMLSFDMDISQSPRQEEMRRLWDLIRKGGF